MAFNLANRVLETTTTTGTGDLSLAGSPASYQTFVAGSGDGNTVNYAITNDTDWEYGIGTITAGAPDVLARDTVLESSNADAKVNWGSGTKNVFMPFIAQNTVVTDADNTFTGANTFTGTVTLPNDTVTNAKLANVATATIKGRTTAGTGDPEDLTPAQARNVIDVYSKAEVDALPGIVEGAEVATTSGTAFDFTGIPSGTKRITISFVGVSLTGSDDLLVQIGDSGGFETTGYTSSSALVRNATTPVVASSTSGFHIRTSGASSLASGQMILTRVDGAGLKWASSHSVKMITTQAPSGGGDKTLSDELTQLRITRSGSDTFDAGSVNITYEA